MIKFHSLFILLGLGLSISINAQSITINWEQNKSVSFQDETFDIPFFSNTGYRLDGSLQPIFTTEVEANGSATATLTNLNSSQINESALGDLPLFNLPTEPEYSVQAVEDKWIITLKPLYRNGNQAYRINSFSLEYQVSSANNSQGTNQSRRLSNNTESIDFNAGEWYKIAIQESGVYRLDYNFFTSNGISTNFDPRNFKIYGNGGRMLNENPGEFRYDGLQENAIEFVGEEDGTFDSEDFIIFYAQGPHDWTRGSTLNNTRHRFNIFSDDAFYYLNISDSAGKRIQTENSTGTPFVTFDTYHALEFYENDDSNLNNLGRQWVGQRLNGTDNFEFELNSPVNNTVVEYRIVGQNQDGANIQFAANGNALDNYTFPTCTTNCDFFNREFATYQNNRTFANSDSNLTFSINTSSPASGAIYLDWIEVKYDAELIYTGEQFSFRNLDAVNDGFISGFEVTNADRIWNVSDISNAIEVLSTSDVYNYQSTSLDFENEFVAFSNSNLKTKIDFEGSVSLDNIGDLSNVNYLIISHPDFLTDANRLANYHQSQGELNTAVISTEQVYSHYASGQANPFAIRDFFKDLSDTSGNLQYAVLFGGASYDFKDRIPNNTNFVPAFQSFDSRNLTSSFVTDDLYTIIGSNERVLSTNGFSYIGLSQQLDLSIGRIPAHNADEAKILVDKILAYENQPIPNKGSSLGNWRTNITLVADDNEPGAGNAFHTLIENEAGQFLTNNHPEFQVQKLYTDAFEKVGSASGARFPAVNQAINESLNEGTLLLLYFGHGGPRGLASERILVNEDISSFGNFNRSFSRLPILITITCDFTVWDVPNLNSGGELFLKSSTGGIVGEITTSRAIPISFGEDFNEPLFEQLFEMDGNRFKRLGDAVKDAKINSGLFFGNNYRVNLLGDPAMSLARPPREVTLNTINGESANSFIGTLKALDTVTFSGSVLASNGTDTDTSFNGDLSLLLFDKPIDKSTLQQTSNLDLLEFQEQITPIARTNTTVENGLFESSFTIPKDINFEVGNGKLVLYAENGLVDGLFSKEDILVGDINTDNLNDTEGPQISLFINDENFTDGDITDPNPVLIACLTDDSGINSSGGGIGHDITAVIDGNLEDTKVLNVFFDGGQQGFCANNSLEDFQQGRVEFPFQDIEVGMHELTFTAWDILNNSSTATINFSVLANGEDTFQLSDVFNWPNPFTQETYFNLEHNCAESLDISLEIYDLNKNLVKTINQTVSSVSNGENYINPNQSIAWDGTDDSGNVLSKGVYYVKARAQSTDLTSCPGTSIQVENLMILK